MPRRPRTGLVLGAGGVLGAAWMAGALAALQRRLPYSVGAVDRIVGTSAGSALAAALRCGVAVEDIVGHQRGTALAPHRVYPWVAAAAALATLERDRRGAQAAAQVCRATGR